MTTPGIKRPMRPCLQCATPTAHPGGRCTEHTKQRNAAHNQDRAYYHTTEWAKLRTTVLNRDYHQCVICSAGADLHVHHITPRRDGGKDTPQNLVTLCGTHHRKIETGDRDTTKYLAQHLAATRALRNGR